MNIYIVKLDYKVFNRLLKYNIYYIKIKKNKDNYILYLDYENYEKIKKFSKIYKIELIGYKGLIKYLKILKQYYLFFIMFFLAIIYIIFLANIIFKIEVKTDNLELNNLIIKELDKYGISLYKFKKKWEDKEEIKEIILKNNKDKIEWLEITNIGSKYIVNVEERIINEIDLDNTPRDIVALKNAIILKIEATRGSIVKKLNDYAKAGEVIVSGSIVHNDQVVDLVKANANIYGETWYNVHVSYPIAYYEKTYTGNTKKRIGITFLNKKINLFGNYKKEEIEEISIFNHKLLPFKINLETVKEVILIDNLYTKEEAINETLKEARVKLLKSLPEESKILSEKKLKIIINNSTIDMDVFFKVYENITATRKISQ